MMSGNYWVNTLQRGEELTSQQKKEHKGGFIKHTISDRIPIIFIHLDEEQQFMVKCPAGGHSPMDRSPTRS